MKFSKMPEVEPEEKLYGFQVVFKSCIVELYICFDTFKFRCHYHKEYKDFMLSLGFLNFDVTNNREV